MKLVTKSLIAGVAIVAGAAFAQTEATEPGVIARKALMSTIGGSATVMGDMAGAGPRVAAAAAEAAKAAMIAASAGIRCQVRDAGDRPGVDCQARDLDEPG